MRGQADAPKLSAEARAMQAELCRRPEACSLTDVGEEDACEQTDMVGSSSGVCMCVYLFQIVWFGQTDTVRETRMSVVLASPRRS